ncbi:uncharacterized protein LOC124172564 [Ischnura elegans]|uniref:uncharacterized protein LOC124172564 n=1 Tax=Ischnura elegans TaxID=197161 RepID=UPI001ED8849D|nr:uncharacterized protein LOC124172564 [Ischnura elegans]
MCPLCLTKLTEFSVFKKICLESNAILRKIPPRNYSRFIFRGLEVMVPGIERVTDVGDIGPMLMSVDGLRACPGVPNSERTSIGCLGFVPIDAKSAGERNRRAKMRSPACTVAWRQTMDRRRKQRNGGERGSRRPARVSLKICRAKNRRLTSKVNHLKATMQELQEKCSSSSESQLLANISNLPERQQEGVRACFAAPQLKNPKNRRYTLSWVYECLLIRIKSRKAYEHLRKNNILCLPGANTLSRYIRNVKGAYGFQGAIFHCLTHHRPRLIFDYGNNRFEGSAPTTTPLLGGMRLGAEYRQP